MSLFICFGTFFFLPPDRVFLHSSSRPGTLSNSQWLLACLLSAGILELCAMPGSSYTFDLAHLLKQDACRDVALNRPFLSKFQSYHLEIGNNNSCISDFWDGKLTALVLWRSRWLIRRAFLCLYSDGQVEFFIWREQVYVTSCDWVFQSPRAKFWECRSLYSVFCRNSRTLGLWQETED